MKKSTNTLFSTPASQDPTLKLSEEQIDKLSAMAMKSVEDKAVCVIKSKSDFEQHQPWLAENLDARQLEIFTAMMTGTYEEKSANESQSGGPGPSL